MAGLGKRLIAGFLPDGAAWNFRKGGGLDKLLDGIGAALDALIAQGAACAFFRNPRVVSDEFLPDLAAEFGVNISGSTGADRNKLAEIRYNDWVGGFVSKLQQRLNAAGFGAAGDGLCVTQNAPFPARPDLQQPAQFTAGDKMTETGSTDPPYYRTTAGAAATATTNFSARNTGYFLLDNSNTYAIDEIDMPPQTAWGLIFFVGGAVQRNAAGRIVSIAKVAIPAALRNDLHTVIMQIKPLFSWAFICVDWT